ncbi:hypothetical protein [Silvibacterium dinghuense]|uniref:Uncharacterized protein n=1 Tax=Silvibacterium dinghuense TaxID=1560006 RepID=A0A4V1NVW9_9BACT|nr:hypothetical protein [Silvibacterium dinghuense]RXS97382.1 hypothetical protein ESZ00_05625 [Silvibacterium dinghuense]GGG98559.1 hypothetical protein GCM10011586_12460 [Silvibacterium dinghuense]
MKPERVGRGLGVGLRVASGMIREKASQAAQSAQQQAPVYAERAAEQAQRATERARAVKREGKRFGESIWGPFVHAGGVLWLEITGVFFAVFGLFFIQSAWKIHQGWRAGAEHVHFVAYAALAAIFFWFAVSSFLGARKKERRKRASAR